MWKRKKKATSITTFFDKDTIIKGNITTTSSLRIDGILHGGVRTEGNVLLGKEGNVKGNIFCRNISVDGTIDGNIIASESIFLSSSSQIVGTVVYQSIEMEEGAIFIGKSITYDANVDYDKEFASREENDEEMEEDADERENRPSSSSLAEEDLSASIPTPTLADPGPPSPTHPPDWLSNVNIEQLMEAVKKLEKEAEEETSFRAELDLPEDDERNDHPVDLSLPTNPDEQDGQPKEMMENELLGEEENPPASVEVATLTPNQQEANDPVNQGQPGINKESLISPDQSKHEGQGSHVESEPGHDSVIQDESELEKDSINHTELEPEKDQASQVESELEHESISHDASEQEKAPANHDAPELKHDPASHAGSEPKHDPVSPDASNLDQEHNEPEEQDSVGGEQESPKKEEERKRNPRKKKIIEIIN